MIITCHWCRHTLTSRLSHLRRRKIKKDLRDQGSVVILVVQKFIIQSKLTKRLPLGKWEVTLGVGLL